MTTMDLHVSPLGQVEGDLDVKVTITDYDSNDTALAKIKAGNYPMERYEMPAAEVARWQKVAGEPIWEDWVKKMEAKGHKEAREILNTTLDLLKKTP